MSGTVHGGQKRASDLMELDLWAIVSHHVVNQTRHLCSYLLSRLPSTPTGCLSKCFKVFFLLLEEKRSH